ncbi:MAG: bifunctional oligoribonuclease/PAP phosphatase NrnA [Turicibacter sp.]|nr:bifunctional oligoribonuclease/PAP phosphatase NrnA [Turicibacter sp.]
MMHTIEEIRGFIDRYQNFYVLGHANPDGDCLGASFGIGMALRKMGKNVRVLVESHHSKYNLIPGRELIYSGELDVKNFAVICLDCADVKRLEPHLQKMATDLPSLCIDHHYSNVGFMDYNFVDGMASSSCEMVFNLLNGFVELDKDIATALYAGMVSDTGGFRHATTTDKTMRIAGVLTKLGVSFTEIYTEIMLLRTYTEVKLLARILEACKRCDEFRIVHVCVTTDMFKNFDGTPDATKQNLDGMIEHLLNIRRATVALLIYERGDGEVKISMRSKKINVGAIAAHFGGGGHKLAAGATVKGDIFEVESQVLPLLQEALKPYTKA